MRRVEREAPFWKTALVALLIFNPAAHALHYCPVAYHPLQPLCPGGSLPPPTLQAIRDCALLLSSSDQEANFLRCNKVVRRLQPYNQWREAIEEEDIQKIKSLCDYGIDFEYALREAMDKTRFTSGLICEHSPIYAIFKTLLEGGVDPNQVFDSRYQKKDYMPPLTHLYLRNSQHMEKLIDLFLKFGASPMAFATSSFLNPTNSITLEGLVFPFIKQREVILIWCKDVVT